ncbi:MAG: ABC transporter substrate-binding protein [Aggregatilineales bacterium]
MRKKLVALSVTVATLAAALSIGSGGPTLAQSNAIVYNGYPGDPPSRAFDKATVDGWNTAHPDMPVQFTMSPHESYKQAIRAYLISTPAPDVLDWFGGERARFFISKNLITDISDVWKAQGWDKAFAPGFTALGTVNGKQYFLSNSYYWWALYFRPSILKANNLQPPKTFDDLLNACDVLNKAGLTPITIGDKDNWPAAAWFDYLDMRINGPEFHIRLMSLQEKYSDPKVAKVFTTWKQLFDHKCFNKDAAGLVWQDGVTPMAQGKAAMYLMGQFINDTWVGIPASTAGFDKNDLDFVRFPIIDPSQKIGEDAPTDGWFLALNGANQAGAKQFLAYLGSKEVIQKMDDTLGRLPVRVDIDTSKFTDAQKKGINLIQTADYVAQFYDRDSTPPMAQVGLSVFGGFYADYGATDIAKMQKTLQDEEDQLIANAANDPNNQLN